MVNLSDNRLRTIHPSSFSNTKQLEVLDLKNNQLSFSDNRLPFMHLGTLKVLNLGSNHLTQIPYDLTEMSALEKLYLGFNQISSVKFNELQELQFNRMEIVLNVGDQTNPSSRSVIYLNDNNLKCDCGMYDFLMETDKKEFASVYSHKCRKDFVHFKKCIRNESSNGRCPAGCRCTERRNPLGSHIFVSCEGNGLTTLPLIEFKNATAIELNISNNNLTSLPKLPENVVFVQASRNRISTIELTDLPPKLRGLDVSHNKLEAINAAGWLHVKNHEYLEVFLLEGNPFECFCGSDDTLGLLEFARDNKSITDLYGTKCNSEYELTMEEFTRNCNHQRWMEVLMSVTILTLLFGTAVVLFYKHKKFIRVWLYAHNCCLWWLDEEYLDKDKKYDAFISYSQLDCAFAHHLVDVLESNSPHFKFCVHERDFIGGEEIEKLVNFWSLNHVHHNPILPSSFADHTIGEIVSTNGDCSVEKFPRIGVGYA